MSVMEISEDVPELLFFDTFSHDIHEKLNLDLVQFPKPVYITEVRIIPLGARVKANFSGGVRLGATNPSQFQIEFFVNDLGKGASTFENLGSFDYNQNDCIHLECKGTDENYRQIPTDGLVLRGWYTTITLAVYGTLTKNITEPIISPQAVCEPPAPILTSSVPVRITTPDTIETNEPEPKWPQEIAAQVSTIETGELYNLPEYVENYENREYQQHEYFDNEVPKDPRPYAKIEREWNQNSSDAVIIVPEDKDKKIKIKIRTPEPHDTSVRSHDRTREFSRSPSREYVKREWSHSPEYNRQRRNRGGSFDRSRRGASYDRLRDVDKKSPNFDEHRVRRPRSPTGSPRHPRSPTVQRSSSLGSEDDTQFGRHSIGNGNSTTSKTSEKSQTIRVIDHSLEERSTKPVIQSPSSATNTPLESPAPIEEDDSISVGEQFEPILSDEDIADELDPFGDLDYDLAEHEEPIKVLNPFTIQLERFISEEDGSKTTMEDLQIVKYLQQIEKTLLNFNSQFTDINPLNFKDQTSDCKEIWVHFTEQIVQNLSHMYACDRDKNNEYLTKFISESKDYNSSAILINCIKIGLDFDAAFNQLQAGYKIRHIKCGIRLAEYLCCYSGFMRLLIKESDYNIFEVIFDLYSNNYMALSIKLMIVKAIYSMLDTKDAIDYFLCENGELIEDNKKTFNGYIYLIKLLKENESTRLAFALKSLIKKINLYESLQLIRENVIILLESTEKMDVENELIYNCLQEIHRALTVDEMQYSQPRRYLPVTTKFENTEDVGSKLCTNNGFLAYFKIHHLLETIVLLLGVRNMLMPKLVGVVQDVLSVFLQKPVFLEYFIKNIEATNHLVKFLLHDVDSNYDIMTNTQELGLEIVYKVQTKYYLIAIENSKNDLDKLVEYLQSLFCLTFTSGRQYVVQVICMDNNLIPLINLIDSEKKISKEGSPGIKCKSPVLSYSVDLVDCAVRHCENIEFMKQHGQSLLSLVKQHDVFEPSVSAMLQEMAVYLKPLEIQEVFSYNEITPLVEMMKRTIEFITTFPGDLIMSLRILRYLGIAEYDDVQGVTENIELKYKYIILKLYSADGVSLLISILEKLNSYFEQPDIHSATLINNQGILLTQILMPTIQVLRKMITYVIQCRNTDFKDLTSLDHLLKTYSLMHSISTKALCYKDAKKIQAEIIHTILTYTQPSPAAGMDTENIHKSLWTQMIGEILKFILNGPYCFIPGLMAFSELLPLPLPVPCKEPLTESEVNKILSQRQLWSAHLHPQSQLIAEMIQTICTSSYPQVLMILSRVCLQLSDLAPNMTLLVSKSIIELILNDPLEEEVTTSQYSRLFNFLGGLVEHPSVKVSVLSILGGKLLDLITTLLKSTQSSDVHIQLQENIHLVLQNLLDTEISMMSNNSTNCNKNVILASALPSKEILSAIINLIVDSICRPDCASNIFLTATRSMLLLTENNATFSYLLLVLDKKKNEFNNAIEKFVGNYANDKENLHPLFITLFEFFKALISLDSQILVSSSTIAQRNTMLDSNQLVRLLNFTRKNIELDKVKNEQKVGEDNDEAGSDIKPSVIDSKEKKVHYLYKLLEILNSEKEDDLGERNTRVDDLEECINIILNHLNGNVEFDKTMNNYCNFTETIIDQLPQAEGIVTQYASRTIFALSMGNFDEQLNANYWLNSPAYDEETTIEKVSCDLTEIIRTCLPAETNITADCKRLLHLSASPQSSRDRIATASCFRTRRVEVEPSTGRPEKKIYATPPRGRGFTRSPLTRGDLFRSRPPNTSRPPSLHVDDFLALETCGVQLVCPTGYNKIPREIIPRGRGAGRGRGFMSERGRISIGSGASSSGSHWQNNSSQWSSNHDISNSGGQHQQSHFSSGHHYRDQQHFGAPSSRARLSRGLRHMGARVYPR